MRKYYIGSCVNNPFKSTEKLMEIIDKAREITIKTFLRNVSVAPHNREGFKEYPNDYTFHKSGKDIYFFTHSAIEYFYSDV